MTQATFSNKDEQFKATPNTSISNYSFPCMNVFVVLCWYTPLREHSKPNFYLQHFLRKTSHEHNPLTSKKWHHLKTKPPVADLALSGNTIAGIYSTPPRMLQQTSPCILPDKE